MTGSTAAVRSGRAAVEGGARPPLARPQRGRFLGGVAAGLSAHLGVPVPAVRLGLLASCLAGGFGVILYLWLWALVPAAEQAPSAAGGGPGAPGGAGPSAGTGSARRGSGQAAGSPGGPGAGAAVPGGVVPGGAAPGAPVGRPRADRSAVLAARFGGGGRLGDIALGGLLLLAAMLLLVRWRGWHVQLGLAVPAMVVGGGALLAYAQLDEVERGRWVERTGVGTRGAALRVVGGLAFVVLGIQLALVQRADVFTAGRMVLSAVAVLAGTGLVLAPWGLRLWRDLDAERAARAREAERADIAAHLHDSVLQTLALIQRHSVDPGAVSRLARAQERELRDWLYGPRPAAAATLAGEVRRAAAEIEDVHGVTIDVVVVGDRAVDEPVGAVVAALREAILNAARHAGGAITVYVESGPDRVEAFVRDRGPGFVPAAVPPDRLGVRESIIGRMERHGGSAAVRSVPGEGTEVRLVLPSLPPPEG